MPKVENGRCFFTQQLFLVGTYNADGSANFAPISWVSYTWGSPSCLVISMFGNKRTKDNTARDGLLTATIVTPDLLPLVEDLGGPPVADKGTVVASRDSGPTRGKPSLPRSSPGRSSAMSAW